MGIASFIYLSGCLKRRRLSAGLKRAKETEAPGWPANAPNGEKAWREGSGGVQSRSFGVSRAPGADLAEFGKIGQTGGWRWPVRCLWRA